MDYSSEEDNCKEEIADYKGIFYNSDHENNVKDPTTGAHFSYHDMCARLQNIQVPQTKQITPTHPHITIKPKKKLPIQIDMHQYIRYQNHRSIRIQKSGH